MRNSEEVGVQRTQKGAEGAGQMRHLLHYVLTRAVLKCIVIQESLSANLLGAGKQNKSFK